MTTEVLVLLLTLLFAVLTWLLGISYFLGRHTARLEAVERASLHTDGNFEKVFTKLDFLSIQLARHEANAPPARIVT